MRSEWFDPVAIQIGPLAIRWYGLAYFTGIIIGYLVGKHWYFPSRNLSLQLLDKMMTAVILGIILGGRIGAVFIYHFDHFLKDPIWLFKIGIFFGRIANFINGELVGRVTDVSWAIVFPHVDHLPRHPSQLYEALSEGVLLFLLLIFINHLTRREGVLSAVFLFFYGIIRFIMEYFREPENPFGAMWFGWDMGQWLSFLMILAACALFWHRGLKQTHQST